MDFEVTEVKKLGSKEQMPSLSIRLENESNGRVYTIHAVVPYSIDFGPVQIGQVFKFERVDDEPANNNIIDNWKPDKAAPKLTESERREFLKANGVNVKKGERV
jgi:hypothetical protein